MGGLCTSGLFCSGCCIWIQEDHWRTSTYVVQKYLLPCEKRILIEGRNKCHDINYKVVRWDRRREIYNKSDCLQGTSRKKVKVDSLGQRNPAFMLQSAPKLSKLVRTQLISAYVEMQEKLKYIKLIFLWIFEIQCKFCCCCRVFSSKVVYQNPLPAFSKCVFFFYGLKEGEK